MIRAVLYITFCLMAAKAGAMVIDKAQRTSDAVNGQRAEMCAQANEVAQGSCRVPE